MEAEVSSAVHLKNLTTKRDALTSELQQGRAELKAKLQTDIALNGEGARFAELEQQIKSLDEAIIDCENKVQDEQNEVIYLAKRARLIAYNAAAKQAQDAAQSLDAAAIALGEAFQKFYSANNAALLIGSEFGSSSRRMLPRDFQSILCMLHPVCREHLRLERNLAEARRSFSVFAARLLPEDTYPQNIEEINSSGWFILTFPSGATQKVPRSRLAEYLSPEQMAALK